MIMIRRSAREIVGNEPRAHQLWKVFDACGFWPSNSRNGDHQRHFISSSFEHDSGSENSLPLQEFVARIVKTTVPGGLITPRGLEGVPDFSLRKERTTEQYGINGIRDHRWWIGSTTSPSMIGFHGAERPSCLLTSSEPGRSSVEGSSPLHPWNRFGAVRMFSTKQKAGEERTKEDAPVRPKIVDEGSQTIANENGEQTKEEVPARPKSIDDFKHEEIVGPTVERDESDTANQLRESLGELTALMVNLRNGFLLLGSVQLLTLVWSSAFHGVGFFLGLSQDFALVMSFVFAYLLRVFGSRVDFFSKIEGRSRMRILTLSLQANKMLSLFFFRSNFVVKAVAVCSLLALLVDVWLSVLRTQ